MAGGGIATRVPGWRDRGGGSLRAGAANKICMHARGSV